jgi:hypothetical protein
MSKQWKLERKRVTFLLVDKDGGSDEVRGMVNVFFSGVSVYGRKSHCTLI